MSYNREFLQVGNELYEIVRRIREDQNLHIETWKQQLFAEKVFKKEGYLFFCILVPEAEIVKDEPEPISQPNEIVEDKNETTENE